MIIYDNHEYLKKLSIKKSIYFLYKEEKLNIVRILNLLYKILN